MLEVTQVTELHRTTVSLWHMREIANPYPDFLHVVCEQHKFNFLLWHEEDIARSRQADDGQIAAVKRAIDLYNQQRNDWIEKLDDYLLQALAQHVFSGPPARRLNTETPGSAIDRLSILALRIYHMEEQAARPDAAQEHRDKAEGRLAILHEQHRDLSNALRELLDDIFAGRKRLKVYRQFKMYNDPTLNPYLYQSDQRRAG